MARRQVGKSRLDLVTRSFLPKHDGTAPKPKQSDPETYMDDL
jgi:hypothetical protein